jgi:hypothetical protein
VQTGITPVTWSAGQAPSPGPCPQPSIPQVPSWQHDDAHSVGPRHAIPGFLFVVCPLQPSMST